MTFDTDGAEILSGAVSASDMAAILPAFDSGGHRPGARSLALPRAIRDLVDPNGALGRLAQRFSATSDGPMRPVRVLLFDKTAETNWMVPWHQDRTIAVAERHDLPGYGNWNVKDGVTHVEPPIDLLARMVTLRLHLDNTGPENGALDIVPGSHRRGRLPAANVLRLGRESSFVPCVAGFGDVLAMRLQWYISSPSWNGVLHLTPDPEPPEPEQAVGVGLIVASDFDIGAIEAEEMQPRPAEDSASRVRGPDQLPTLRS